MTDYLHNDSEHCGGSHGMDLPKNHDAYIVNLTQLVALAIRAESPKTL
jgi:hypothetical protein